MEELWDEIEAHLRIVDSNLGICCQDYCDAATARNELDQAIDKMAEIRLIIEKLWQQNFTQC